MADKETIMTWLKKCGKGGCSSRCPYDDLGPDKCYETLMTDALELLREQPEQKHGHWIGHSECPETLDDEHMACSVCGCTYNIYMNDAATFDYCPQCGAKMDEAVKWG